MSVSSVLGGAKKPRKSKTQTVDLKSKGKFKVRKGKLHRALNIPENETIGPTRIKVALNSPKPNVRRMARSARGLTSMKKG